ncbi:hypothetical protein R3P38DRAFT_3113773 [Favolaschia claudopus]|uniref:F-box domain-containing protein n=1 Tax=Favolaschia claudopus TaxID=2862362 RepID=A0AAV9ZI49_9AGAR
MPTSGNPSLAPHSMLLQLPNELLGLVMRSSSTPDLLSLCLTSRLMYGIASRALYRIVCISNEGQLGLFIESVKSGLTYSQLSPFPLYLKAFIIQKHHLKLSEKLSPALDSLLPEFHNLQHLDLVLSDGGAHFTHMLAHANFPRLEVFRYCPQSENASFLAPFLNRHPTIAHIFLSDIHRDSLRHLDPVCLPNLRTYTGCRNYISALVGGCESVRQLAVYDISVYAIPALGALPALHTVVLLSLLGVDVPPIVEAIATHAPHIRNLSFQRIKESAPYAGFSQDDVEQIARSLERFPDLAELEFPAPEEDESVEIDTTQDPETVKSWSQACRSLRSISLNGKCWLIK